MQALLLCYVDILKRVMRHASHDQALSSDAIKNSRSDINRDRALRSRATSEDVPFGDLLVVGGGITGLGVALDAASRGLSVALVERDDFSSGTSSKSSKLPRRTMLPLKP